MGLITVDYRSCRELIVVFLSVERFSNATIVFLTFGIAFTVFKGNAALVGFFPVISVISIEMAFVEAEFRKQNGCTGQLIVVAQ